MIFALLYRNWIPKKKNGKVKFTSSNINDNEFLKHFVLILGPQMKPDEACDIFGVDQAIHMDNLGAFIESQINTNQKNFIFWYDYLNLSHIQTHRIAMRFVQGTDTTNHSVHSPCQSVQQLRLIKKTRERDIMKRTCQIGAESITEAIRDTSQLTSEAQVFAKIEYEAKMRDADFLAYPPVVAAGNNANTIHYTINSRTKFKDRNDLILVDAGCDYGGYCSDITRTWPLSGKFSPNQRLIYDAVLDIQTQLISILKEDAENQTVDRLYRKMQTVLGEKLVDLGLVSDEVAKDETKLSVACQEFCPHHVSHYLGMDVHDTKLIKRNISLQDGMVITMEPGIYIPLMPPPDSKYLSLVPNQFRGIGEFCPQEDHTG